MDIKSWSEWIGRATAATLLGLALVTNQMGFWYSKPSVDEIKAERDTWKQLALKGANVAQQAITPKFIGMQPPYIPPTATPQDVNKILEKVQKESD